MSSNLPGMEPDYRNSNNIWAILKIHEEYPNSDMSLIHIIGDEDMARNYVYELIKTQYNDLVDGVRVCNHEVLAGLEDQKNNIFGNVRPVQYEVPYGNCPIVDFQEYLKFGKLIARMHVYHYYLKKLEFDENMVSTNPILAW
jgi:hypothetical protein